MIFIAAAAVIGLTGWQVYHRAAPGGDSISGSRGGRTSPALVVEAVPIQRKTVEEKGNFSGSLLPRTRVLVASKVGERLEKLFVDIGDRVKNGQLIAVLDEEELLQQVEQARAELQVALAGVEDAKVSLNTAQREYERIRSLREKKIASEAELDQAEARFLAAEMKYRVSEAQVKQKEAALKTAEIKLSYTRITVFWEDNRKTRVIGERFVEVGEMLKASDPIVSVLDIDSLIAEVQVIERDYSRVRVGQKATITTDAFPGREFQGIVSRIAPVLKETSRQAQVNIEVPNPGHLLKPGMFINARIVLDRHEDATVVPLQALVKRDSMEGVFIVDREAMTAHFVPVKPGIKDEGLVEILQPPLSGLVVTLGQHLLEEGSPVTISEGEKGTPAQGAEQSASERAAYEQSGTEQNTSVQSVSEQADSDRNTSERADKEQVLSGAQR